MPESDDGVFLDLNIKDKVTPEEVPVGVVLQAMAEYGMLPMATPAIHRLIIGAQNKILNPAWLKEQEAKMQEQRTIAEGMHKEFMDSAIQQYGIQIPSADDLE